MKRGKHDLLQDIHHVFYKGHRGEALLEYCDPRELFTWTEITEQYNGLCPQQHFLIYQCYNARNSQYSFHSLAGTMDNVYKSYICVLQRVFNRILIL